MKTKIYVVMGQSGEYSNHGEWPVCAYRDQQEAERRAFDGTAKALELYKKYEALKPADLPNWWSQPQAARDEHDRLYVAWENAWNDEYRKIDPVADGPNRQIDYFVLEVDLEES